MCVSGIPSRANLPNSGVGGKQRDHMRSGSDIPTVAGYQHLMSCYEAPRNLFHLRRTSDWGLLRCRIGLLGMSDAQFSVKVFSSCLVGCSTNSHRSSFMKKTDFSWTAKQAVNRRSAPSIVCCHFVLHTNGNKTIDVFLQIAFVGFAIALPVPPYGAPNAQC
jgi:hypothetical protein